MLEHTQIKVSEVKAYTLNMFQFIERCGYAEPYDDNNRRGNYILQFTAHDLGYNDQGGLHELMEYFGTLLFIIFTVGKAVRSTCGNSHDEEEDHFHLSPLKPSYDLITSVNSCDQM